MRSLVAEVRRVAATDVSTLVRGETGTGKELVARALHDLSPRCRGPFVALNCAAMPESLIDSELFGHERAAFTGAAARHAGKFEQANGGTLFLDEVAELGAATQARLLRVLQERRFHRIGGTTEVHSEFRLVAASHRDLADLVARGEFRQDLFFRIAVYDIAVPPLRDRGDDVVLLARHFVERACRRLRRRLLVITPEAEARLREHAWPGNVRELENAIQRAVIQATGGEIRASDLRLRVGSPESQRYAGWRPPAVAPSPVQPARQRRPSLPRFDSQEVEQALAVPASLSADLLPVLPFVTLRDPTPVPEPERRAWQPRPIAFRPAEPRPAEDGRTPPPPPVAAPASESRRRRSDSSERRKARTSGALPILPLAELEKRAILASWERHEGRIADMVAELEIGRTTLYRKLAQYGVQLSRRD